MSVLYGRGVHFLNPCVGSNDAAKQALSTRFFFPRQAVVVKVWQKLFLQHKRDPEAHFTSRKHIAARDGTPCIENSQVC